MKHANVTIIPNNNVPDENASCHIALGKAYPTNLEGGSKMNEEELDRHGVNDSLSHRPPLQKRLGYMLRWDNQWGIEEILIGRRLLYFEEEIDGGLFLLF